jgi:hypothetical protein
MKKYPRIHSLGTLNLRHHQEAHYDFHPLRTDFTGESGHGKSMIADLLQLIFVGGSAYRAATEGLEGNRPAHTMPLPGQPFGYAFLNIEIKLKRYITIGVYQENSPNTTQMFIIQGGFGFSEQDKLQPFNAPITTRNFQRDGSILPVFELSDHLEPLAINSWATAKPYHRLLFANELLPVDLANSDHALKTYSNVLQAFARGQSLGLTKRNKLLDFLFGPDAATDIYGDYERTVNDWQRDTERYKSSQADISEITKRGQTLQVVYDCKIKRDELRKEYLTNCWQYHQQQLKGCKKINQYNFSAHYQATVNLQVALEQGKTWHIQAEKLQPELSEALSKAAANQVSCKGRYNQLQKALIWQEHFKCEASSLRGLYEEDQSNRQIQAHWFHLERILKQHQLEELFANSDWPLGVAQGVAWTTAKLGSLTNDLLIKRDAEAFLDPSKIESLGYWAMKHPKPFDRDQVSILMGLKTLLRNKPTDPSLNLRYIPNPADLLLNLEGRIMDRDDKGFWLIIGEFREYFTYEHNDLLEQPNPAKRQNLLLAITEDLKSEIVILETECQKIEELSNLLLGEKKSAELLASYINKIAIATFQPYDGFSIQPDDFTSCVNQLLDRETVEKAHKTAEDEFKQSQEAATNNSFLQRELASVNNQLDQLLKNYTNPPVDWADWLSAQGFSINLASIKPETINIKFDANKTEKLQSIINSYGNNLYNNSGWINWKESWEQVVEALRQAEEAYLKHHSILPPSYTEDVLNEPSSQSYNTAVSTYNAEYGLAVRNYLGEEAKLFEGVDDFMELARHLFPELAARQSLTEEGVFGDLAKLLTDINEDMRKFTRRKLDTISRLLERVSAALTIMRKQTNQIQQLFDLDENQITGAHSMKLIWAESKNYPLNWIRNFRADLQNKPSFDQQFISKVAVEQNMQDAFHLCGGPSGLKPSVRELLNPSNYVDLRYEMQSEIGETNNGSSGQAYAAVAMLCIARISSLVVKNQKGLRYMAVDEAEGLGANYDLLTRIARQFDYQIVSLSVRPLDSFELGQQHIHMLCKDKDRPGPYNHLPTSILSSPLNDSLSDE